MSAKRVAFFTDSFNEVNGVALTSREFVGFARRRGLPMFSVHAGPQKGIVQEGSVTTFEFQRGPVRWNLEHDLAIDFLFLRYRHRLREALEKFQPDLVHITGPSDSGMLGVLLAHQIGVPLVASWHTNLHEFGARRLSQMLGFLPQQTRVATARWFEKTALDQCMRFYRLAKLVFAPNAELVELLALRTGRPAFLMSRGIDTELFSPARRARLDQDFVIGYVGRLSPEKHVRLLAEIEESLIQAGMNNYRFLIVGHGSEHSWLSRVMRRATLPGILGGEDLARALRVHGRLRFSLVNRYVRQCGAGSDGLGHTDHRHARRRPQYLVHPGTDGEIAGDAEEFARAIVHWSSDPERLAHMRIKARASAERFSWDAVWEEVYRCSECALPKPWL